MNDDTKSTTPAIAPDDDATESANQVGQLAVDMDFIGFLANSIGGAIFNGHLTEDQSKTELAGAFRAFSGIKPTDETEGMLAAQLVALHSAGMECLRRAAITGQPEHGRHSNLALGTKLLRNFSLTLEALNKHRGKGQQTVRVEHVTVNAGGQAIVGDVHHGGSKQQK